MSYLILGTTVQASRFAVIDGIKFIYNKLLKGGLKCYYISRLNVDRNSSMYFKDDSK